MKNLISIIFLLLLLPSCSEETFVIDSYDIEEISLQINVPSNEDEDVKTRSYSDGSAISGVKCYTYAQSNGSNSNPIVIKDIPLEFHSGIKTGSCSLYLPKNQTYDFVFIATSSSHVNPSDKIYFNSTNRTLNINYDKILNNDDSVDGFIGVIKNASSGNTTPFKTTLRRPFAQINIGTKDLEEWENLTKSSIEYSRASVNGVYSTLDVMNNTVLGNTCKASFGRNSLPSSDIIFPAGDATYLSMNYVLVKDRTNVDIDLVISNNASASTIGLKQIPIQQNFRTNVSGNLLIKKNDYNVVISSDFSGRENNNIGYDLVIKLVDNYDELSEEEKQINIYYSGNTSKHVNLNPYIDSSKTIKVSWDDLGIRNAQNIRFTEMGGFCPAIKEVVKFATGSFTGQVTFDEIFWGCNNLQKVNFDYFDSSKCFHICRNTFSNCKSLSSLNLSKIDTSREVQMIGTFASCTSLTNLDLSSWNTSNVYDMSDMFSYCTSLSSINLDNWNTSKVHSFMEMFDGCGALTDLDLSSWNTYSLENAYEMFAFSRNLQYVNLSNWNLSRLKNMNRLFYYCSKLEYVDILNWNIPNDANIGGIFEDCKSLISVNMTGSPINSVKKMVDNLPIFTKGTHVLKVSQSVYDQLDKSIASNKGWTVVGN